MKLSASGKALLAGTLGTALQWYDFAIFGYFAPIIAKTFFPQEDHFASLLSAFGVFAVGYLLAPLGAIFFGYIGDGYGRKTALSLSILSMAIPTATISLIPSYAVIGIAAPLLITFFRVLQGFVASAEFTGSAIFLVEHARPTQQALFGSLTSSAYSTGMLLAGLAASFFTASFMPLWGWRLGFAVALIAGIVIFYLRQHVSETPVYLEVTHKPRAPFLSAIKEVPFAIIGVMGISWLVSIMTFGTYVFTATYLHTYFNISLSMAALIISVSLLMDASLEPFIALVADKIGLIKVSVIGMSAMLLLSVPIFHLIASGHTNQIVMGMVALSILIAIIYAPLNAYMVSLFPQQYRYSGFGVAFNVGVTLFGGTTPLVMMWLIHKTKNVIAPAWYYELGAIIGLISLSLCELSRKANHKNNLIIVYSK